MRTMPARRAKAAPASPDHPFLVCNGVKGSGIRQEESRLMVPMRTPRDGEIGGIQEIDEDGQSRHTPGCQPTGAFHVLGTPQDAELLVIVEDYATGVSLLQTDQSVAVAVCFDKQNLIVVGNALSLHYQCPVAIAADVDSGSIAEEKLLASAFLAAELYDPRLFINNRWSRKNSDDLKRLAVVGRYSWKYLDTQT